MRLLRHCFSQSLHSLQATVSDLPVPQFPMPNSPHLEVWAGAMEQSGPQLADLKETFLAPVPHQTSQCTELIYEKRLLKCVRAPAGEKIIYINKVLLWESGRPHKERSLKQEKTGISISSQLLNSHERS